MPISLVSMIFIASSSETNFGAEKVVVDILQITESLMSEWISDDAFLHTDGELLDGSGEVAMMASVTNVVSGPEPSGHSQIDGAHPDLEKTATYAKQC